MSQLTLKSLESLSALVFSSEQKGESAVPIELPPTIDYSKEKLKIGVDKKLKGGKVATYIFGWQASDAFCEEVAKELKALCGAGGSYKNEEILIQGQHLDKIKKWLQAKGCTIVG